MHARLRRQVAVGKADRVAVPCRDRRVEQEVDEPVCIRRVRRVRRNGRDIEPHDRPFARNRITDAPPAARDTNALLGLHRIAVAGDDQTQLARSQIVDQRARGDLANGAARGQQRATRTLEGLGIFTVGLLAQPRQHARDDDVGSLVQPDAAVGEVRRDLRVEQH